MSARFFEGLEGRRLFSGSPIGPGGPGPNGDGNGDGTHLRQRLRDGTCQTTVSSASVSADAVKDQIRQRLHDGSCQG